MYTETSTQLHNNNAINVFSKTARYLFRLMNGAYKIRILNIV